MVFYAVFVGNKLGIAANWETAVRWKSPDGWAKKFETWSEALKFLMAKTRGKDIYSLRINPPRTSMSVFLFTEDERPFYYIFSTFQNSWNFEYGYASGEKFHELFNKKFENPFFGDVQAEAMGLFRIFQLCTGPPRHLCIYFRKPTVWTYIMGFKQIVEGNTPYFYAIQKALEKKKELEELGWEFSPLLYTHVPSEEYQNCFQAKLFIAGFLLSQRDSWAAEEFFGHRQWNLWEK